MLTTEWCRSNRIKIGEKCSTWNIQHEKSFNYKIINRYSPTCVHLLSSQIFHHRLPIFWLVCLQLKQRNTVKPVLMLCLHYVPGGHGSHDFGHRGRNGVTVTQRRGTGSTNVARRGRRDHRDRFLNRQKICHGSHGAIDLLKYAVLERGARNKTWQNVTDLNTTWSMSVAGRLVTRRQPKVCQGLSRSIKFCCAPPRFPNPTPQLQSEHGVKETQIDASEEESSDKGRNNHYRMCLCACVLWTFFLLLV